MPPSVITLEKSKFNFSEALVIVISQSGKSEDLVECEKKSKEMGATTMLITNNENSPIINEAHYFFNMYAGEEKSVCHQNICTNIINFNKNLFISFKKKMKLTIT